MPGAEVGGPNRQMIQNWEERYRAGDTPWEDDQPNPLLVNLVASHTQLSDTLLEVGCGHGHNAVALAKLGYRVIATDLSETAVAQASSLAEEQNVRLDWRVLNVLDRGPLERPINVIYENGVLHTFFTAASREDYVTAVSELLPEGGLWISVSGSAENVDLEDDPDTHMYPRLKLSDIVSPAEVRFDVVEITQGVYGLGDRLAFKTWNCVMRRRRRS